MINFFTILSNNFFYKKIGFCSFIILVLSSCSYNQIDINKKIDQEEGRKFVANIYEKLMFYQDNESILASTSHGKEKLDHILNNARVKMGTLISYDIKSVETKSVEKNGLFKTVSYLIKIHVKYKNGESDEVFALIKQGDDKIFVNGYNIYSDLML